MATTMVPDLTARPDVLPTERLLANGTKLLVTVDCGITAVEEVSAARAGGMDVVITDHHSPRADGTLPGCPIVHPVVCGHPSRDLCGTGVAHKLAEALGAATAGPAPNHCWVPDPRPPPAETGCRIRQSPKT